METCYFNGHGNTHPQRSQLLHHHFGRPLRGAGRQSSPGLAIERHQLKGDKERLFSQVLSDLDLHHHPCHSLGANNAFYALGSIAHYLLHAIKLPHMPDEEQALRTLSLIQVLMLVAVQFKRHARSVKAVCCVSTNCLAWWRKFIGKLLEGGSKYFLRPRPGSPGSLHTKA